MGYDSGCDCEWVDFHYALQWTILGYGVVHSLVNPVCVENLGNVLSRPTCIATVHIHYGPVLGTTLQSLLRGIWSGYCQSRR